MTTRSTVSTSKKQTKYASGTKVTVAKSREEIEKLLSQYGGTGFGYATQGESAGVQFELQGRRYRIMLTYPSLKAFHRDGRGALRTDTRTKEAQEQEVRRLWRALVLVIKAKIEAVQSKITTIEKEFLGDVVMPNNQTVNEWLEPQIQEAYRTQQMPPMMPGLSPSSFKQLPEVAFQNDILDGEIYEEE